MERLVSLDARELWFNHHGTRMARRSSGLQSSGRGDGFADSAAVPAGVCGAQSLRHHTLKQPRQWLADPCQGEPLVCWGRQDGRREGTSLGSQQSFFLQQGSNWGSITSSPSPLVNQRPPPPQPRAVESDPFVLTAGKHLTDKTTDDRFPLAPLRQNSSPSPTSARFNKSGPVQAGPCPAQNCTAYFLAFFVGSLSRLLLLLLVQFSSILTRPRSQSTRAFIRISITLPLPLIFRACVSPSLLRTIPSADDQEANIPAASASAPDKLAIQARSTKTSTVGPSAVSGTGGPGHVESRRKEALGTESALVEPG